MSNRKFSDNDMIRLARGGRSVKEIADRLGISENTVKNHCSKIYHRLGVRNRVEASLKFLEFKKGRWCKLKPSLFCQEGYCLECEIYRQNIK